VSAEQANVQIRSSPLREGRQVRLSAARPTKRTAKQGHDNADPFIGDEQIC
jgi:hypothetical protein